MGGLCYGVFGYSSLVVCKSYSLRWFGICGNIYIFEHKFLYFDDS